MSNIYSEEQKKCASRILEIKTPLEANIIFSLYKQPDLLLSYELKSEDFINKDYRNLFYIINGMVNNDKIEEVNDISIGMYLEGHEELKEPYELIGGWEIIQLGFEYNIEANFDVDYDKNIKYSILLRLLQLGYPIAEKLEVKDKNGLSWVDKDIQTIYEELDFEFNNVFTKAVSTMKIQDITEDGENLIDKWNEGDLIGLPFWNFPLLTSLTGGLLKQNVTIIGASSNSGKSSLIRGMVLPSLLKYEEPALIILNEEPREKWLREELVRIANNELNKKINKNILKNGHFPDDIRKSLEESLIWLKDKKDKKLLNFISFPKYSNSNAIKTIKQASSNGISQIIIDTFKCDNDRASKKIQAWEALKENMVDLYNVARERDASIITTVQLKPSCDKVRYLTRQEIGESTGIIEAASTAILMRRLWDDEYTGEKNAISVYKKEGNQKVLVPLDKDKTYLVLFVDKSREGAARTIQVVAEVNWAYNTVKEIGFTKIPFNG